MSSFTDSELEAYLDEDLLAHEMSAIESVLRDKPELVDRLVLINRRRDSGVHSLGEIWRRHRISCPSREQLGSYLLGALDKEAAEYIDLQDQRQKSAKDEAQQRRRKYFQTSAGLLKSNE